MDKKTPDDAQRPILNDEEFAAKLQATSANATPATFAALARRPQDHPADAVAVYLAGFAPSGRVTVARRLVAVARLLGLPPEQVPWAALRAPHLIAIRARLLDGGTLAPATINLHPSPSRRSGGWRGRPGGWGACRPRSWPRCATCRPRGGRASRPGARPPAASWPRSSRRADGTRRPPAYGHCHRSYAVGEWAGCLVGCGHECAEV